MFELETFFMGALIESFSTDPDIRLFSAHYCDVMQEIRDKRGYHFQISSRNEGKYCFYTVDLHGELFKERVCMTLFSAVARSAPATTSIVGCVVKSNVQIVGHQKDTIQTEEAMFFFSMALGASNYWKKLRKRISKYHMAISKPNRARKIIQAHTRDTLRVD